MQLQVKSKLSYTSIPSNTVIKYNAATHTSTFITKAPSREIIYYFRTQEDLAPQLLYAKDDELAKHPHMYGNQVAANISILPSFWDGESKATPDQMVVQRNRHPYEYSERKYDDFLFIFIIDRSYSMSDYKRIETVIDAVRIFLRSLPKGSSFSIISFGDRDKFREMTIDGKKILEVDASNIKTAIAELETFEADMGGTYVRGPMERAFTMDWDEKPNGKRRIFFLTDG